MDQLRTRRQSRWISVAAVLSALLFLLLLIYHGPRATLTLSFSNRPARNLEIPLRVLAIGDSTTRGGAADGFNSYRPSLRNLLLGSGRSIDFIGSMTNGDHLDNEHEGHAGRLIKEIQAFMVEDKILLQHPNLILLHAGTNDMNSIFDLPPQDPYEEAPHRLQLLVDSVLCECPDAVVILARIIDNRSFQGRVRTFNAAVEQLVEARQAEGHKIWLADHSHIGGSDLGEDGVHPLINGYEKMADAWFQAVQELPANWIQPAREPSREHASACKIST
ncbi:putative SGNH hydrolase-type esterase domain, SGNH hydrolase superfamily [Septoria linicola]|nr:putative SGNH hydrolase-type esterase domain, SGNH hydrolase superfamily [Septoria linicola]